jgi:hypothetical protein
MSKYSTYDRRPKQTEERELIHPIWRGIGFAMIVLIPLIAIAGAIELVRFNGVNHWVPIPPELIIKYEDPLILVKAIVAIALGLVVFAVFQFFSFLIFRLFSPPRYGFTDVPSVQYKRRRK